MERDLPIFEIDTTPGEDDHEAMTDFDFFVRAVHKAEGRGASIACAGSSSPGINLYLTDEARKELLDFLRPAWIDMGYTDSKDDD